MLLLDQIDQNLDEMIALVQSFANINSHSYNPEGIEELIIKVREAFSRLYPEQTRVIRLKKNPCLLISKRSEAPLQLYFGGHLDTVFSKKSPFQTACLVDNQTLTGPGVTDMKGGLVILLKGLEAFEQTDLAQRVGWRIFLNSDEEIGSIHSTPLIKEFSKGCALGIIFEPPLPNGSFVHVRKGSQNYIVSAHGVKGHAGRDAHKTKSAIYPLARFITEIEHLNQPDLGNVVNVGIFQGGETKNVIPDYAECHLNARSYNKKSLELIENTFFMCAKKYGLHIEKFSERPPKPFDPTTQQLFELLKTCGSKLGHTITWERTGGVCDGNCLAAYNIPTIDTFGVNGGMIHTEQEFLYTKSLPEKAKLLLLFLTEIVSNKGI